MHPRHARFPRGEPNAGSEPLSVELLKYPVIILSILVALIVLKFVLGLELGVVTELSTEGVRFAEQSKSTVTALAELETRLEELTLRVEAVEERAQMTSAGKVNPRTEVFSTSETVTDATARVSRIAQEMLGDDAERLRGYILIGTYDGQWQGQQLTRLDTGQREELSPKQISSGSEYAVRSNMILRDGLPAAGDNASREARNTGVVVRGSRVRVLETPVRVDRGGEVQYWVEVEFVSEPAAK